jgi:Phage portal protein
MGSKAQGQAPHCRARRRRQIPAHHHLPGRPQFLGAIKANVSTIYRFYGVAPTMMAGETGGHEDYSSPEMRGTEFLTFTLRPWLYRVERAISTQLLPSTQRAKFNAGGFVGFLTVNEARELEDRPPLPPTQPGGVA